MKHQWKLDKNGKPDEWAWEYEFHNGVYCKRCGKTVCIHCDPDWEQMDDCEEPPKPKPKTNADRIRAMTDEELADWVARTQIANIAEALEWLQQPAEGE